MRNILSIVLIGLFAISCKHSDKENSPYPRSHTAMVTTARGIYHWKTTFDLSQEDTAFIRRHDIKRLYVRMFDVGVEKGHKKELSEVAPLGTTKFISEIPKGCSVIPTVYITLDALRAYYSHEEVLADLIITRIFAMASWNELGNIREVQFDCDWTEGTRHSYYRLCEAAKEKLSKNSIMLSGTIRLHQLEEKNYPFDKAVLMIYNTGSFINPDTENSILDYDDVHKYLSVHERTDNFIKARENNCKMIEIAYPAFGWGVVFNENGKFSHLVSNPSQYDVKANERMRVEISKFKEIERVKMLVDSTLSPIISGNIIYHLDTDNLKAYSDEEIDNIFG